jgi:diguanylate cyclase (GGDEF)-like protein/PAS domain S-box-containing protein
MTNGLRQMLASEIRQVDMALLSARSAYVRRKNEAETEAVLSDQLALLPWADSLRITDASGIVRYGPGVSGPTVDLSDRAFFNAAKGAVKDELIFSEPLKARISKKWVVAVARRLQKSDGSFDGVVYSNVATDAFRQRFAEVDVGHYGAISLRTASRQLVSRHAPGISEPPAIGSATVSSELERALTRNARTGFYVSATALDGVERMTAYQAVDDYPFIVLVGLSTADYFEAWRQEAYRIGVLLVLSFATLFGASQLVLRSQRRERESLQLLMGEGLRNRALLRAASDGVQVLDRRGQVKEASESLARMLGRDRNDLVGQHVSAWDVRFSADHINGWLMSLPNGEPQRFTSEYRRNDGSLLDVEVRAAVANIDGLDYVYCSVRDISELKRARAAEVQATERLNEAIEALPAGFELYDANDKIVLVNSTMKRMYPAVADLFEQKISFTELVRSNWERGSLVVPNGDIERWIADRQMQRRTGGAPIVHQLKGGDWVRTYERRTRDGGLVGVRIDVTELMERDRELERVNTELDAANAELRRQTEIDPLTGIANRRRFERELVEACASGEPMALLIFDIDYFKRFNDHHGHPAGDACLRRVAAVLTASLRGSSDLAARLGGEEFTVLLPGEGAEGGCVVAQRCTELLAEAEIAHGDSPIGPRVTFSVGIAVGRSGMPTVLMENADAALYRAKHDGRDRWHLHASE